MALRLGVLTLSTLVVVISVLLRVDAPGAAGPERSYRLSIPSLASDGFQGATRLDQRFGLQMGMGGYGPANREVRFAQIRDSGVGIMRGSINWVCPPAGPNNCIETAEGVYDWTLTDSVATVASTGVSLVMNVSGYTCLQGHPNPLYGSSASAKLDAYRAFVRAIVQRYKHIIRNWQIEDEIQYQQAWCGSMELYGTVLKAAYEEIKREDPTATVLMAALGLGNFPQSDILSPTGPVTPVGREMLMQIKSQRDNTIGSFDVLDLHLYHAPEDLPARIRYFSGLFRDAGFTGQTWVTETGGPHPRWDCELGFLSEPDPEIQAAHVLKRFALGFAAGADRVFWLGLSGLDPGPWSCNPQAPQYSSHGYMQLVRAGVVRPALLTYGLMTSRLSGFVTVTVRTAGPVNVVEFLRPDGPVFVAWSSSLVEEVFPLPVPIRITHWDGRVETRLEPRVTLSPLPVIVDSIK